ncbi:MAG: hypothetical protein H0W96_02650 [Solirubrobacterales bacterium]|nr:hypothetical protein [Solirubrobacterales bacterium]
MQDPGFGAGDDLAVEVASDATMFWRRKKKDAISAWQTDAPTTEIVAPTTEIVTGELASVTTAVTVNAENYDPSDPRHREALEAAEAATGVDLDGDGKVAERPAGSTAFSTSPATDPISQLERLQRLRESGALTRLAHTARDQLIGVLLGSGHNECFLSRPKSSFGSLRQTQPASVGSSRRNACTSALKRAGRSNIGVWPVSS